MTEKKSSKQSKVVKEKQKDSNEKKSSVHGMYHYIKQAWKQPDAKTLRERMTQWRSSEAQVKVDKPLRLDKARELGYKDKVGFVIIRIRLKRGGHRRPRPNAGRRTKRMHTRKTLKMSYKWIAEQRVQNKYTNLEVLNSYLIGKDGVYAFYEVICVDPQRPEIKNDPTINWISKPVNRKRASRGLTSAAKKSRGLMNKHPTSKVRPSVRAGLRRGK